MILFYLLVTVMPLSRHPLWSRFFGDLTIIKYLGIACLLYAIAYLTARRAPLLMFQTWQARWFGLLALLAILSFGIMGAPVPWEESPLLSYISFLGLFFTTLVVVDSVSRLRWVLLSAIGSVAFASLHVLREWQKYGQFSRSFRPGWIVGDANYYTISALLCLPIALFFLHHRNQYWERLYCLGCLIVTLAGITAAASRGGLIGLAACLLYLVSRSRRRARDLAFAAMVLVPLMAIAPASPMKRFFTPRPSDMEAVELRKDFWEAGRKMVQHHPLTGIGLGNFKRMVSQYSESALPVAGIAHNTYFELAAELGLVGLAAFIGILLCSFRTLERVRWRALALDNPLLQHAALGIQAGLVGYATNALFISAQYQKLFWLMVFLSMCLPTLVPDQPPSTLCEQKGVWSLLIDRTRFPWTSSRLKPMMVTKEVGHGRKATEANPGEQ